MAGDKAADGRRLAAQAPEIRRRLEEREAGERGSGELQGRVERRRMDPTIRCCQRGEKGARPTLILEASLEPKSQSDHQATE